ncbi:HAD hydrolase family protein [Escherichia coli]|uniref:HAD hydrolase family protein n=1 Tax=Escherichia coli TaxID=562 RepID=UPI00159DBB34
MRREIMQTVIFGRPGCPYCVRAKDLAEKLSNERDDFQFFKFGLNLSDELIPQVQKALHEAIGDIMVPVHTGNGSIDLIIPGVHKANGLRQLQKLWGIDDSEVVVFGDGGNDIEMLRQAGFSFAMENAGSAVVAAAKYRAGSNNREGVLDVIDKVLKHEAPFKQ